MTTAAAKMLVMVGEKFACVKIVGRANFTSSVDFKTLVIELRQKGYAYFVLDLSECLLMDSTFLGVLAGFGLKMGPSQPQPDGATLELLNPNTRITELLENLGVLDLFKVTQGNAALLETGQVQEHTPVNPTRDEVKQACLEAHQTLMQVNPANIPRFKEVTAFLAEDLKKLKT